LAQPYILQKNVSNKSCLSFNLLEMTNLKFLCIYYRNRDNGEYKTQKFPIFWPFVAKQYILEKNVLDKSCLCFYKLQIIDLKFSSIFNKYRDNWEKVFGP
jgi:hypothetical protein